MNNQIITAQNVLLENSERGVISKEELRNFINSLTENDVDNFNKFLRHVRSGRPINFNQRKLIDRSNRAYYFINQRLNGSAHTGYKLMIFQNFDEFLERITEGELKIESIEDLKLELNKN
ncbi:hypothetical protein [Sphingobacterium mizutaii]|uniref:hypothetical protein n=1 Tax=Sphingobacterium mizutaii TaxID=1010 RepID=UPI00162A88F6|nr:hypothetical protein [Sphingobacterium mizutaii]